MTGTLLSISVFGFIAGVFIRSFVQVGFAGALFLFLLSGGILVYSFSRPNSRRTFFLSVTIFFIFVACGIVRYEFTQPRADLLAHYKDSAIVAEGVVSKEPDEREKVVLLTVHLDTIIVSGDRRKISDTVLVLAPHFPDFSYGDRLRVHGVVQKPENFETDGGRLFDYQSYLAKDDIYYELFQPRLEVVGGGEGNPVVSLLLRVKRTFLGKIETLISEPESALLGGLLLGEKHSLGADVTEAFRRSGLVHVIVLSGYNMTIVAYFLMRLFSRLPKVFAPLAGALGIIAFTVMAGASATAVRAALMALLVILAQVTKRDYRIARALYLAGFVMVLHNPRILVFDPSFQLSFLATLSLIYLSPIFARYLTWVSERFGLRDIVSATISTQIFVLPFLTHLSGTISLVSLFSNLLVLPFIPATMLMGFLTGMASFVYESLALPFAFVSYWLLHYEVAVAQFFGSLPFASISVPATPVWFLALVYLALFLLIRQFSRDSKSPSSS